MRSAPQRKSDLGGLAEAARHNDPIDVSAQSAEQVSHFLQSMLQIRVVEEHVGELAREGLAKTPCHLGIGQEGVAVGVAASLNKSDRLFGGHRSHSQFLALGGGVYELIAEVLGKQDGASRGMGGSMHLYGGSFGFHGSVPIVGATIPIAVGAGLACKMDGAGDIAVAFFGDGACEEGVFHESLNFAAVYKIPVLFIVENNLFSSHLDIQFRQPSDSVARFADAHRVSNVVVDGNDVVGVAKATDALVKRIRSGAGPALMEAVTYRYRGHVGPNEDIDVGVHRKMEELAAWKRRCPIERLTAGMEVQGILTPESFLALRDGIEVDVATAVEKAIAAPYPDESALLDLVYSGTRLND